MSIEQIQRRLAKLEAKCKPDLPWRALLILAANHSDQEIDAFLLSQGIIRGPRDAVIIHRIVNPDRTYVDDGDMPRFSVEPTEIAVRKI